MPQANGRAALNHEALQKIAEFMEAMDDVSSNTGVEIVGIVPIEYGGESAGSLSCLQGSETVWTGEA